jgi:endonuclease III
MTHAPDARTVFEHLDKQHPNADTELVYSNAFELLVATILSAQTTDAGVNLATPALFAAYPDARALAAAPAESVEQLVLRTGFFRQKARSIIGMASALVDRHGGEVPAEMDALVQLPGVGRKTANVVLGHALGVPGLPVDRHVLRVSNRLGLAHSDDPEVVERQLCELLPPASWTRASDTLILHGRRVCTPQPQCDRCSVRPQCQAYAAGTVTAGTPASKTRTTAKPRATTARAAKAPAPKAPATRDASRGASAGRKKTSGR